MRSILCVFGTRPEAVKMAPVIRALQAYAAEIDVLVCVTAQHRSMLDQVLDVFGVVPDFDLNIMEPGQDLSQVTAKVLAGFTGVLRRHACAMVLAQGDTTTTMAASLAAFYARVPVGHVEAGLRTFNLAAPWPEEANRQLTSRIATYHYAPTERARRNLLGEGVPSGSILVTGNTVVDALQWCMRRLADPAVERRVIEELAASGVSRDSDRQIILVTGHRRENFGQGFQDICQAIRGVAEERPGLLVVFPVHLNPNVRAPVMSILGGVPNIRLLEPLDYLPFCYLLRECRLVLTDSGGVQEEAPSLGKPVLVMRETTERPEAVEAGTARLVGTDRQRIQTAVRSLLEDTEEYRRMSVTHNPYGDGLAAKRIADHVRSLR